MAHSEDSDREPKVKEGDVVFQDRVAVGPEGTFFGDLDLGSLHVEAHDEQAISVVASAGGPAAGQVVFSLEREDDRVYLDGETPDWPRRISNDFSVKVEVRVPRSWRVDVKTAAGTIRLNELGAAATAEVSAGSIVIRGVAGAVTASTLGGPILVERAHGDVSARTRGGPVTVREVGGDARLRTVGGPIRASGVQGRIHARAGAGPISVRFGRRPAGNLQTGAGAIEARLPPDAGAEVDARTSLGRVSIDRELDFEGRRESSSASGRLGRGGETLRLRTSIGAIRLGRRSQKRESDGDPTAEHAADPDPDAGPEAERA